MSLSTTGSGVSGNFAVSVSVNEYEFLRLQKDVGKELIYNIREILRDEDINFTEDLANSFTLVLWQSKAWIESSNHYAGLVDKGMKPGHFVNFDALYDWVRIKLDIEEPDTTAVTWKIMKKIQNEGIAPKRYVKKAIKMLIGKHGLVSLKHKSSGKKKKSRANKTVKRIMKAVTKINKAIRKTKRTLNKVNKNINKYTRPLRKYK
jgi:prefoldin subunit 5